MTAGRARGTLGALALLAVLGGIWYLGAGLTCAALSNSDPPLGGAFCRVMPGYLPPATATGPTEIPHEDEFYAAVIDTVYQPQRAGTASRGRGVLLIAAQTTPALAELRDSAVVDALHRLAPAGSGDSLAAAFRIANATVHRAPALNMYRATVVSVDSSSARQLLGPGPLDASARSVVENVLLGLPVDSLPDILALSRPAMSVDSDTAIIFASLHSRRSREPDHLEAAGFLVVRRDGFRWSVTREIPVSRLRTR
jgi:hypothetical protein